MYAYVPTAVPSSVSLSSVAALAMPKSTRYAKSSRVIRMFSGLTSRCMMPVLCAASSAEAIWRMIATARAGVSGPYRLSTLRVGAVDQAHVEVQLAVDLAVVVDRHHVRFLQPPGDARSRCSRLRNTGSLLNSEGNSLSATAILDGVLGLVDLAHPAAAEQPPEAIGPEQRAYPRLGRRSSLLLPINPRDAALTIRHSTNRRPLTPARASDGNGP